MQVNMQRDGPVRFAIGGDDGSRLFIDGSVVIDSWGPHAYVEQSVTINLSKGYHTLTFWYYQAASNARVSFNCDPDITMWPV